MTSQIQQIDYRAPIGYSFRSNFLSLRLSFRIVALWGVNYVYKKVKPVKYGSNTKDGTGVAWFDTEVPETGINTGRLR